MQAQVLPGDLREGIFLQISPDISRQWCSGNAQGGGVTAGPAYGRTRPRPVSCCTHMHTVMQFRPSTVRLRPVLSSALPASNDVWGGGQGYSSTEPLAPNWKPCYVPDKRERVPRDHLPDPFEFFPKPSRQFQGFQDIYNRSDVMDHQISY